MNSSGSSKTTLQTASNDRRYDRVRSTATFRDGGFERFTDCTVAVIGCGLLGGRIAVELVRSGARVFLCDKQYGEPQNEGTQIASDGERKVDTVARACDQIRPARACGFHGDVLHLGIGVLAQFDLIIDATDDPRLAQALTEISNGLRIPLLRAAVDGSGLSELGRVQVSHGGAGNACQLCSYTIEDLRKRLTPTPCPGQPVDGAPPTIAGTAIAMTVGGIAVLQTQRLLGGNDAERAIDREVIIDLSHGQLLEIQQERSSGCLSGHETWQLTPIDLKASNATLRDVFEYAKVLLAGRRVRLETYGHTLYFGATCECGHQQPAIGTRFVSPSPCSDCGNEMKWTPEISCRRFDERAAADLGILDKQLGDLGLPEQGAMILARASDRRLLRLVLAAE